MANEQPQFENLTRIFVQNFRFDNSCFNPSVEFKLYNKPCKLSLKKFSPILCVPHKGTTMKFQEHPPYFWQLYKELCNDDDRSVQRGKIRSIQFPAIRYFTYYLAR